ncbi:MAG TPA: MerC domain-containing protein [Chitinophagaceae bacterium]|nr:MerC domain-containing protein [Chitinophagaceae bacterium]
MKGKINWDALGISASVACAIHCAVLPLCVTTLPLFGVNIIHNMVFESTMVLLAFSVGAWSFYHGFVKHHHSLTPFFLFAAGILLLVLKLFFVHYETWLLIPAVAFIVSAHFLNYRSCRIHDHAHEADCSH